MRLISAWSYKTNRSHADECPTSYISIDFLDIGKGNDYYWLLCDFEPMTVKVVKVRSRSRK